jgi:hypothetical protein
MRLPLSITQAGSTGVKLAGFTLDISSQGVLFACKHRLAAAEVFPKTT